MQARSCHAGQQSYVGGEVEPIEHEEMGDFDVGGEGDIANGVEQM
jgi:hypothetical protein